ncbi:GtrA family protein [Streptacidiphilus cavernicola]|uniref:GtrA family protein n=1 Tax=Streptacidiphilus cavernicola TaxID=3342716 RepID=A0ABV6VT99_9ACTN
MTTTINAEPAAAPPSVMRRLVGELAKFGIVGIVGLVVQFGTLPLMLDVLPATRATMASTGIAIATNYIGYRYWVYRDADKKTRSREIALFLLFSGIGLVIQTGMVYALTGMTGMNGKTAVMAFNLVGIAIATLFRFWSYRTWVFRAVPAADPALAALPEPPR